LARSGTGFIVNSDGNAVTNFHVIEGCSTVSIAHNGKREKATVVATDNANDLALLKVGKVHHDSASFRKQRRAALGEQVVVAGYPLKGLLTDDLNVATGTVSAIAGPGNDARLLQISAPVQAGNSGGPLLDNTGSVMGVIVSKLNAIRTARIFGDIPQNVNFAIKGIIAQSFLNIHGVDYRTTLTSRTLDTVEIAARARRFTVAVECWK